MILLSTPSDTENILSIWLAASIKAHHFISADYWRAKVVDMRDIYLPMAQSYVYRQNGEVVGFYSFVENCLAAIFVAPEKQGQGIGKQLLNHAKQQRPELTLNVYQKNLASVAFYQSQGFRIIDKSIDEATGEAEYLMRYCAA